MSKSEVHVSFSSTLCHVLVEVVEVVVVVVVVVVIVYVVVFASYR